METKTCSECEANKPLTEFNVDPRGKNGCRRICRNCSRLVDIALTQVSLEDGMPRRKWRKHFPSEYRIPKIKQRLKELINKQFIPEPKPIVDPILKEVRKRHKEELNKLSNSQSSIKEGFVYIVTNPSWDGMIKIGSAIDYEDRLNSYQTYDPNRAYTLKYAKYYSDRKMAENNIHKHMEDIRVSGEWFKSDVDSAITYLNSMNNE